MIKQIKQQQSDSVNDSCTDCGSYVDIGAVVEADDTLLQVNLNGDNALAQAQALQQAALERFSDTKANIEQQADSVTLSLQFAFSVEKMIFQLEHAL
ncbi:DUF406 family protein [Shewanella saliphila]|uniref:DUF406 family protein n=1 Tax=Shewanella saliphila TaxID=2282698 RepID=A0ABQ2Q744_9GAMM|nr:DUF406 family protein [Shewanella saliphila]MCL1102111.1 YfcZ/YiiS family protein [Shewanella saliphila]GGP58213.1 hypothetical protein GCM10009409_25180 [Shewanella saliphila]